MFFRFTRTHCHLCDPAGLHELFFVKDGGTVLLPKSLDPAGAAPPRRFHETGMPAGEAWRCRVAVDDRHRARVIH